MRLSTVSKLTLSGLALSLAVACKTSPGDGGGGGGDPNAPCSSAVTMTAAQAAQQRFIKVERPIPGEYVVVLKEPSPSLQPQPVQALSQQLNTKYGGTAFAVYEHALRGFASKLTEDQAQAMSTDPEVD